MKTKTIQMVLTLSNERSTATTMLPFWSGSGTTPGVVLRKEVRGERKYRYCLTTLTVPKPHCIGFARRRIGRGGR
ncbi:hypothetical protein MTO96_047307 [Rhipicephalus appendiculatus]